MTRPPAESRTPGPDETRAPTEAAPEPPRTRAAKHRGSAASDVQLEKALLELRTQVQQVELTEGLPGAEEGEAARRDVLDQLNDYVLPRVRRPETPLLIAVAGSTGAGKSTLVNSLVGEQVTTTGARRPTTNSPVLACNPADVEWFDERSFLPSLPRVRQQGLARPGKAGVLVLAASECMPPGVALLDTPDVDSVVASHHEFAAKFLDVADLWVFVTTSVRYADARVWEFLRVARDRNTSLAVVLSRVPHRGREQLVQHFGAMLEANGLGHATRFTLPVTDQIAGGRFTGNTADPLRNHLADLAGDIARRDVVTRRTFLGVLESFRSRVPQLARQVERQVEVGHDLLTAVRSGYAAARTETVEAMWDGSLLRGNVLAHWQDIAASGELAPSLKVRSRRRNHKQHAGNERVRALDEAVRDSLETLVLSGVERGVESVLERWADTPGASDLARRHGLTRLPEDLPRRVRATVGEWQRRVVELVASDGVAKRTVARFVTYDAEAFSLVLIVGLLGNDTGDGSGPAGSAPRRLLKSVFGAESLRNMWSTVAEDLRLRVTTLFEQEERRFTDTLRMAGLPEDTAAVQLYQTTYNIEITR